MSVPTEHRAIVNAHFALTPPADAPSLLGLVGGTAEWVFAFPDRLSVTVSAADRLLDVPREELARILWAEITRALRFEAPLPRWSVDALLSQRLEGGRVRAGLLRGDLRHEDALAGHHAQHAALHGGGAAVGDA